MWNLRQEYLDVPNYQTRQAIWHVIPSVFIIRFVNYLITIPGILRRIEKNPNPKHLFTD